VRIYHYISTYNTWPAEARYAETGNYNVRWDEFLQPRSREWETGWDALADRLAHIASRATSR
jgi:hypothetical protein